MNRLVEIAIMCKANNIAHIVNNAYGVQCAYSCQLINQASRKGRVDAYIQSTDKNFMVLRTATMCLFFFPHVSP